jgi:4-amino-4-deoxy-L-arabinose transferase-like glycosyltransferase
MKRLILLIALAAALLLAFAVRVHLLGAQSFWNDEGNSYVQATRDIAAIAENAARDIHPPLYYWLLGGWRLLTGESEFALRLLSALASTIAVAAVYAAARRLFSPFTAVFAALLTALNSFSVYYAQEARMYALLALWGALSLLFLIALLHRPSRSRWIVFGLINAAGLWTQYAFPFFMLAQGVIALLWLALHNHNRLARLRAFTYANLLAIGLYLPWLPTAIGQLTTWPNTGEPVAPGEALGTIMTWLTFGMTAEGAALAIPALLAVFAFIGLRRGRAFRLLVPVIWVIVPLAIFLALGMFRPANLKLLLPAQIGVALWLAGGIHVLTMDMGRLNGGKAASAQAILAARFAGIAAAIWMILMLWGLLPPLYSDPAYQRADYRAIAARIAALAGEDDAIILDAPNQAEVFGYYNLTDLPVYPLPPGLGGNDDETRRAVEAVLRDHPQIFVVFWGETERDPQRIVETTLDAGAFEAENTWYSDVRLARYLTPQPLTITLETAARFDESITLAEAQLSNDTFRAGDVIQIRLIWRADQRLTTRYKVFIQLLNGDGGLVAQRDSEPGGGLALTTTWTPGEMVIDNHALVLPDDLPPGEYTLIAGLYDLNDASARLLLEGGGDALTLHTITVQ